MQVCCTRTKYSSNAITVISSTGNAPDISAVQIYLLNASQLDRRCVSVEYCSALDGVLSLLGKIPNGSSSEAELEKLHMLFVWQSETVFSSFKPVAVFEDVAPVSVGMLPLANPPESREQDCETLVQEALVSPVSVGHCGLYCLYNKCFSICLPVHLFVCIHVMSAGLSVSLKMRAEHNMMW